VNESTCRRCGLPARPVGDDGALICLGCMNEPGSCECDRVPGADETAEAIEFAAEVDDGYLAALGVDGFPERTPPEPAAAPHPRVIVLADVEPERVEWLWPRYLPRGKVVILDGDPSVGKSTVALDLAARISTGSPMPDGAEPVKGAVLILSAEDGLADTIRPRLDAADGDPEHVVTITSITETVVDGDEVRQIDRTVTLPGDLPHIEQVISGRGVVLVVVDVLMAYLSGTVNAHRDQDIRRALHPLAAMADRTACCVLVIRHLNKHGGDNALYRGGGSIGIVGAARAGFMCGTDPEDDTGRRRVLASVKCNLSTPPPALAYQLVSDDLFGCARVDWLGETRLTAAALLADRGTDEERTERDEAVEWLVAWLTDAEHGGEGKAGDIIKAAAKDGIAERTLQRARRRAGVTTVKSGLRGGWLWRLDLSEGDTKAPKAPIPENWTSSAPSASSGAFGEWPEGTLGAEANNDEEDGR
jgi:hypothetical protein